MSDSFDDLTPEETEAFNNDTNIPIYAKSQHEFEKYIKEIESKSKMRNEKKDETKDEVKDEVKDETKDKIESETRIIVHKPNNQHPDENVKSKPADIKYTKEQIDAGRNFIRKYMSDESNLLPTVLDRLGNKYDKFNPYPHRVRSDELNEFNTKGYVSYNTIEMDYSISKLYRIHPDKYKKLPKDQYGLLSIAPLCIPLNFIISSDQSMKNILENMIDDNSDTFSDQPDNVIILRRQHCRLHTRVDDRGALYRALEFHLVNSIGSNPKNAFVKFMMLDVYFRGSKKNAAKVMMKILDKMKIGISDAINGPNADIHIMKCIQCPPSYLNVVYYNRIEKPDDMGSRYFPRRPVVCAFHAGVFLTDLERRIFQNLADLHPIFKDDDLYKIYMKAAAPVHENRAYSRDEIEAVIYKAKKKLNIPFTMDFSDARNLHKDKKFDVEPCSICDQCFLNVVFECEYKEYSRVNNVNRMNLRPYEKRKY